MKISVSENDLRDTYVTALNNPISLALHRVTGSLWYVFDGSSVCCTREPLRPIGLPPKVALWWREFHMAENPSPLEFYLEIESFLQTDG